MPQLVLMPGAGPGTIDRRRLLMGAIALGLAGPGGCAEGRGGPLTIAIAGQIVIQDDLMAAPYPELGPLRARLARADIVLSDLEGAVRGPGAGPPTRGTIFDHSAGPEVLDTLAALSVNLVALSNNHAFDLGSGGVAATIASVRARGIAHAGTGANLAEAARPAFVDTDHGRVALVAMAAGKIAEGAAATDSRPGVFEIRRRPDGAFERLDEDRALDAIATAAGRADIVIAYHHNHWWDEDQTRPPPWLRAFARRMIDAGATLVAGHGAPNLHGIEFHRGRPLIYNPGSLVFQSRTETGRYAAEAWRSFIAELTFTEGRLRGFDVVPIALNEVPADPAAPVASRGRPRLATGPEADRILTVLAERSSALGTRIERLGADGAASARVIPPSGA